MSIWVKICGNTSLGDAQIAVEAGADALGFVFAASPRRVTAADAAAICSRIPEAVEKIGVFVDADCDEIASTVRTSGLTGVQLHFEAGDDLPARLHAEFGPALRILRVVHFALGMADRATRELARHALDPHVNGVLVDSRTAAAAGGTGVTFDWVKARETAFGMNGRLKLIAAGGLKPANVAEAISTLRPWGVDVVSGVEAAPGRKDPEKVRDFVTRARVAAFEEEV